MPAKLAIYPGSFDPVTNGHIDIIVRGLKIFDRIVVGILNNPGKNPLFTVNERKEMLQASLKTFTRVEIDTFDGLLVDYALHRGAQAILRGMRAVSDFEYEFQMALMNRKLVREAETVFLMPALSWVYLSSTIVKDVAVNGGDITGLVPPLVQEAVVNRVDR